MTKSIALFFLFGLGGCHHGGGGGWEDPKPTPTPPPTMTAFQPAIYLSDDPRLFSAGKTAEHFNFAHLEDLWVRVTVPAMKGMSTLHINFTNPSGEMLFEDHAPFTTNPEQRTTMMPIGETNVLQGAPVPGGYALDRRVPIFGTVFTRYSVEGDWQVTASVDGFMAKISVPMHVSMVR